MNIKKYFMFASFLLASLSNASAMEKEEKRGIQTPTKPQQELTKPPQQDVTPKTATTTPVKTIESLADIIDPLNDTLGSASIYVQINTLLTEKIPFLSNLTPDQKIIHGALPKPKTARDYLITASSNNQTSLYNLVVTSLQDVKRITTVVLWKYEGTPNDKPSLLNALYSTSSLVTILETLRQKDIMLFCSNQFEEKGDLMKELRIPFIDTAMVQKPTRVFHIDNHQEAPEEGPKKPLPELLHLNTL